ncbi:MazG nucleotide pyrophosphohydrolase domain-containing protein, partial [uncultured Cobetia sp.]
MSRRLDASVDVDAGRQADTRYTLDDLLTLMAVLRDPQYGCPWDSRQDYASLVPHTLEEAYEVADVIERAAADASVLEELPAELGDLLFQGVFYAQIASEQQRFDFHDVIHVLTEKMLHRHPHVFPDGTLASRREGIATHEVDEGSLNAQWESLKQQEFADAPASQTAGDSVLDGVPIGLPALTR